MQSKDWVGNAKSVFTCNGASNHSEEERQVDDYYATEPRAVELLLEREKFSSNVWECACGGGHMSEVLKQNGYSVYSTDLIDELCFMYTFNNNNLNERILKMNKKILSLINIYKEKLEDNEVIEIFANNSFLIHKIIKVPRDNNEKE